MSRRYQAEDTEGSLVTNENNIKVLKSKKFMIKMSAKETVILIAVMKDFLDKTALKQKCQPKI